MLELIIPNVNGMFKDLIGKSIEVYVNDLIRKSREIYVNDMIVKSKTAGDHIELLNQMFNIL